MRPASFRPQRAQAGGGGGQRGELVGADAGQLERPAAPLQALGVEKPGARGKRVVDPPGAGQAVGDIFLGGDVAPGRLEDLRPMRAQPDDLVERVHPVRRAAGFTVELPAGRRSGDRPGLVDGPAVRPGDRTRQGLVPPVHGDDAVQGAADAHAAAVGRAGAGLLHGPAHGKDRRVQKLPRVLLLPAIVRRGAGVPAHPRAEDASAGVHGGRLAAAGAQVDADKKRDGFHGRSVPA